jgi:hypothetical protein
VASIFILAITFIEIVTKYNAGESTKKWFKTTALFLSGLILFQSCSAYKTPVTLEQAVQEKKK